jgi:hypothetical protein
MHCDIPIRLYHGFPHLCKYNLTIRADEIIVPLLYVWSNKIDMEKSFLNQLFHSLSITSVLSSPETEGTKTYLPRLA